MNSSGLNSKDMCFGAQSSNPCDSAAQRRGDCSGVTPALPESSEVRIGLLLLNNESSGNLKRNGRDVVCESGLLCLDDEASDLLGRFTMVALEAADDLLCNASCRVGTL